MLKQHENQKQLNTKLIICIFGAVAHVRQRQKYDHGTKMFFPQKNVWEIDFWCCRGEGYGTVPQTHLF